MTGNLAQCRPSGIFSDDVEVNGTNHMVKIITSLTSTFVPERQSIQLSDGGAVNYTIYLLSSCLLQPRQNKWKLAEIGTYITYMHSSRPLNQSRFCRIPELCHFSPSSLPKLLSWFRTAAAFLSCVWQLETRKELGNQNCSVDQTLLVKCCPCTCLSINWNKPGTWTKWFQRQLSINSCTSVIFYNAIPNWKTIWL